jgi:hypothetical protein
MNEPQTTKEQEAILEEAAKYARIAEQRARELWEIGEAFAEKWEKRLGETESVSEQGVEKLPRL